VRLLASHGGNLGEPRVVGYRFDKPAGCSVVDGTATLDVVAIEGAALDVAVDDELFEILTERATSPRCAPRSSRRPSTRSAEVTQHPKTRCPSTSHAGKLMRLIDALEDNDDVGDVHANFDVMPKCSTRSG